MGIPPVAVRRPQAASESDAATRRDRLNNDASGNPQRVKASHIRPFLARQVLTAGKNKTVAKTES